MTKNAHTYNDCSTYTYTQKAIYLDIALIFPQLLKGMGAAIAFPPVIGVPLSNCVFYAMAGSVGYALYKNARGELPNEIPVISESVSFFFVFLCIYTINDSPGFCACKCQNDRVEMPNDWQ